MADPQSPSVITALWRFRRMSLMIVLGVAALSAIAGVIIAPPATATATVALKTPPQDSVIASGIQGDASLARYTAQRARFVTSDAVIEDVADRLDRDDITAIRRLVKATPSGTSNTVSITAEAANADEAVDLAAAIVDAFGVQTKAQIEDLTEAAVGSIDATISEVQASINGQSSAEAREAVSSTISELRLEKSEIERSSALLDDGIEFAVAPRVEAVVTAGAPVRELALGLVLGLGLAATVAWLLADRERGITSPLDAESILEAPLLGQLHAASDFEVPEAVDLGSLPSHDYRLVWSALLRRTPAGVLLINAPLEEPRAMAALNLAVAAARENLSVLLVDADVERATLSSALGLEPEGGGVGELFAQGGDYSKRVVPIDLGGVRTLAFLPTARSATTDINISTQAADYYVAEWRKNYDLVLIDAAPIGHGQLASVLSGTVDGVLVVVSKGANNTQVQEVHRWLSLQGTPVVGYVYASEERKPWPESTSRPLLH